MAKPIVSNYSSGEFLACALDSFIRILAKSGWEIDRESLDILIGTICAIRMEIYGQFCSILMVISVWTVLLHFDGDIWTFDLDDTKDQKINQDNTKLKTSCLI